MLPRGDARSRPAAGTVPRIDADAKRPPVRVVVADDQALVRAGFRAILQSGGIDVVGEAGDGAGAVEVTRRRRPDVVLMDVEMPVLDGIEATRRITGEDGERRIGVLMLTTFDRDQYVYDALRAGASGFLLKDVPAEDLIAAVRVVAAGDALIAPRVTRRLIERFVRSAPPPEAGGALAALTPREAEVLALIARGLSNAEIARDLVLSEATVKTHVKRILRKLDLRDRVQAVVLAYEVGLVGPGR